jgi:hypothetical protein
MGQGDSATRLGFQHHVHIPINTVMVSFDTVNYEVIKTTKHVKNNTGNNVNQKIMTSSNIGVKRKSKRQAMNNTKMSARRL